MPGMSCHRYSNAWNSYLTGHVLQPGFGYTISIKDWETPTPSMENISECQSEPAAAPLYYSAASGFHNLTERRVATHPNDVYPRESSIWIPLAVAV
jgi:hypothetical protein